jgi:hypothetical protein
MNVLNLKFAEDILDYGFDWNAFLAGLDTIATSSVSATPTGLTITNIEIDDNIVTVLIGSGVVGTVYNVVCEVVTVGGLTANSAMSLMISENAR